MMLRIQGQSRHIDWMAVSGDGDAEEPSVVYGRMIYADLSEGPQPR